MSLSSFPQPPFEAVPSTRRGARGGVGIGRGQEAMVGGEAREVPLAGEEPRLGLEKGRASGPGGLAGLPVGWLVFGPLTTAVNQSLKHLR